MSIHHELLFQHPASPLPLVASAPRSLKSCRPRGNSAFGTDSTRWRCIPERSNMERCSKFSSMPVAYCWHCQNPSIVSPNDPRYTLREVFDTVHGYPVVIVACASVLRDFGWSTDEERLSFQSLVVIDHVHRLRVRASVEMRPDFEHSTGPIIAHRWLYLSAIDAEYIHIGLGVAKCRALWKVRDELRAWVRSPTSSIDLRHPHVPQTSAATVRALVLTA